MSHLHLPDGVLYWWSWVGAYLLVGLLLALVSRRTLRQNARGFALLGLMAALMILVMSIEIGVYHVNLSVVAAIILGPTAAVLAAIIVNLFLAFVGHGGLTVAGVNALVLIVEMLVGLGAFHGLRRLRLPLALAVFFAVLLGLACGTAASFGVLVVNQPAIERLLEPGEPAQGAAAGAEHEHEVTAGAAPEHGHVHALPGATAGRLDLRRLALLLFGLGSIGWLIEALISAVIARALCRMLPDLFDGGARRPVPHEASHGPVSH